MYPCRAQKHTPRNAPRRRFGYKTERVLGVSLLGKVKRGVFLVYLCRGAKAYAPKMSLAEGLGIKLGWFWAHSDAEL